MSAQAEAAEDGDKEPKVDNLQKASYYYQQALLVFYYLIPDTDAETLESDTLKLECQYGQT